MKTCLLAGAVALAYASPTFGQSTSSAQAPAGFAPMQSPCVVQSDGKCTSVSVVAPLPIAARAETFRLAVANVSSPAATLVGGNYVLTQTCSAYGTLTLRYLGPDGTTMTALVLKTASDSSGGTLASLGANAIVDVALAGTTGCNATLSRIP